MVAAVYGRVDNGERINFTLDKSTGLWEATAPETLKGTYIVGIYAEDYAGNVAYVTSVLCTIDMTRVCIITEASECEADVSDECVADVMTSACSIEVVRCEVCGRW